MSPCVTDRKRTAEPWAMMPGIDVRTIREALLDAYSEDDLRIVLREWMDVRLDHVVGAGNLSTRVFELLEWSERNGRKAELIRAAAVSRPRHAKMQEVSRKYGMSVPVYVEKSGIMVAGGPTDATQAGLERTVRDHLSFADFGVWRERMTSVEGRVCQITLKGRAQGTGFLVGPDAVLTNYHVLKPVLSGTMTRADVECVFDFKKLPDGTQMRTPVTLHPTDWNVDFSTYTPGEIAGQPDQTVPTTDELDYALVRLSAPVGDQPWAAHPGSGAPSRGWVSIPGAAPVFNSPMGVIIAQHPNGWPMKLGIDTSAIDRAANPPMWLNSNGTRVRYATNTEGGSSGSPVFDLEWNLIALHHYGDPDQGHTAKWNQGIPIFPIRERLERQGKSDVLGGALP